MSRRHVAVTLPALLLAVAPATPAPGLPAGAVPCLHVDVGPARSARPVVVCYGGRDGAAVVSVSTDRGRTWTERRPAGTPEPLDHLFSVLVSPAYDVDRTIYLRYQSLGLYASTDGGATFTPVDTQAGGEVGDLMAAVDSYGPRVPGLAPEPAVVIPRMGSAVFYRGAHVPVTGGGRQQDRGFYQLGHGDGSVVLNVSQGPDDSFAMRLYVAQCTSELACPGGFQFPKDTRFAELGVDPAVQATSAVLLATTGTRPVVWSSRDRGRTFTRNAAFDRLMAAYAKGVPSVTARTVAVLPGGKEWLVKFWSNNGHFVLATTDAGRTWHRRAQPDSAKRIVAAPDGRLYAAGFVFRCSLDRARTWHTRCPR